MINNYKIFDDFVEIYVKQRNNAEHVIYVSISDFKKILNLNIKWHVQWHTAASKYYAHGTKYIGIINGKPKYENFTLHSFLFCKKGFEVVDHINGNELDNRQGNIRIVLTHQNLKNRKSKNSNNTSGYRNVSWINGYWRIQLQIDEKNKLFPEKFENVHEAGMFAKEMREKYYGDFAGNN